MNLASQVTVMECKLLSAQTLIDVLNTLSQCRHQLICSSSGDKSEQIRIDISDTGLSLHVTDKTKAIQLSTHLATSLFDEYHIEGPTDSIMCNLEPLSKCVSIFGNSKLIMTTLQMMYSSDERCIKLVLDENESTFVIALSYRMHSDCQIRTLLSVDDIADYSPLFTDDLTVLIESLYHIAPRRHY